MNTENPIDKENFEEKTIWINLLNQRDQMLLKIRALQQLVITIAKSDDRENVKVVTSTMQNYLKNLSSLKKDMQKLEEQIQQAYLCFEGRKKEVEEEYEEMHKIITERENGVWQSSIASLEI